MAFLFRKKKRFLQFSLFSICLFLLNILFSLVNFCENGENLSEIGESSNHHIVFLSAYYYNISKSLPSNTVAAVFLISKDFPLKSIRIQTANITNRLSVRMPLFRVDIESPCDWNAFYGIAPSIPHSINIGIEMGKERNVEIERIPIRSPIFSSHPFVSCISPLVATEQWHWLLTTTYVYNYYGSHIHLYVHSIAESLLKLLRNFKEQGLATVQEWPLFTKNRLEVDRLNVQFGMHSASRIDCFLQYKESAQFINFIELGDLVLPRYSKTYHDDFRYIFQSIPRFSSVQMNREIASTISHEPAVWPSASLITTRYLSLFDAWPLFGKLFEYELPKEKNIIRNLPHFGNLPKYHDHKLKLFESFKKLLRPIDFKAIKEEMEQTLNMSELEQLPREMKYSKPIEHCLRAKAGECPSLRECFSSFSSISLSCILSTVTFSIQRGPLYTLHFPQSQPYFVRAQQCL